MPFASTGMTLEGIVLNEISQTDKDKYHMTLLIRGISKQTEHIDTGNRLRLPEAGGGVWAKWVKGVKRYKHPVIEQVMGVYCTVW